MFSLVLALLLAIAGITTSVTGGGPSGSAATYTVTGGGPSGSTVPT
jgi:hypothetical protein